MNGANSAAFESRPDVAPPKGDVAPGWDVHAATARLYSELKGLPSALADLTALSVGYVAARNDLGRRDHVTLLPNRIQFLADLNGVRQETAGSLILVTLADAKHYNEVLRALGHAFAEEFVRAGARRIQAHMREPERLYHVSVLSFAFFSDGGPRDAGELAAVMAADFRAPVACEGLSITTSFGVGVVGLGIAAEPAATLRHALTAAQDSRSGTLGWALYDRASDEAHQRAFRMAHDLEIALKTQGQLSLNYQPRIALASGHCASAEALLRWRHPLLGPVSPAEFIPLAEATSMIGPLTDWVMNEAIRQAAAWRRAKLPLKLSVNISAQNLKESDFTARIAAALSGNGLDPRFLECEVTETVMAGADGRTSACLAEINAMGIDVAIDDFGSGYSSMSYLAKLPAQVLKIDRSFVSQMLTTDKHRHLVRSIVNLAHDLDYRVVAEGIEDRPSYDVLAGFGCEEGQGFYMSRPVDADALTRWIVEAGSGQRQ